MHLLHILSFLTTAVLVTAQLQTLPQCVQTCLHNTLPQCSGLKCYCSAFNSTTLIVASSCYHSLCDSTTSQPFNIFMADVGPLCFHQGTPIQEFEIDKAAAVESASSFSTYLSLSDPPSTAISSAAAVVTEAPAAGTAMKSGDSMFATNTRGTLGQVIVQSSSTGGVGKVWGNRDDGWIMGLLIGIAGMLVEILA